MRHASSIFAMLAVAALSGCVSQNDVMRVTQPGYPPGPSRAIVVVGATAEGIWKPRSFQIQLSEYSMPKQSITGNCWRWNKIEVDAGVTSGGVEYFVFEVAPGFYAGGANHQVFRGHASPLAFEVPAGRIVYLGDFVYTEDKRVDLRRNPIAAAAKLKEEFPKAEGAFVVAKTESVSKINLFVCGP